MSAVPPQPTRCRGCGTANFGAAARCLACDTWLPPAPATAEAGSEAPVPAVVSDHEAWHQVRGAGHLFLCLITLSIAGFVAVKFGQVDAYVDLAQSVALAVVVLVATALAWPDLRPLLSRFGGWRALGAALACLLVLAAFASLYFSATRWLGLNAVRIAARYTEVGWPHWAAYALVAGVPAVFEELAFRGYVMARLDRLLTPVETLLVQAALFSVLHFSVVIFPSHFVIGALLGLLRRRTGSLYPGMLVHGSWNALVLTSDLLGLEFP